MPDSAARITQWLDRANDGDQQALEQVIETVYRELHRLEKERLITVIRDRGARRYMLTEVGERVLARRRQEWDTIDRGLSDLFKCVDDKSDGDTGRPQ